MTPPHRPRIPYPRPLLAKLFVLVPLIARRGQGEPPRPGGPPPSVAAGVPISEGHPLAAAKDAVGRDGPAVGVARPRLVFHDLAFVTAHDRALATQSFQIEFSNCRRNSNFIFLV